MAEELRILQSQAELAEGRFQRKDGRAFDSHRAIEISKGSIGTADGSSLVRLGDTCVVCGLRGEIAEIQLGESGVPSANIGVEVKLPFKNIGYSNPSEEEQALSQTLQNILMSAEAFQPSPISDRFFWVLHVTITCLAYDGNLTGASLAAISGALSSLKLPGAHHDLELDILQVDDNYQNVKCTQPIGVGFGIINDELVVDMSNEETLLSNGESMVVIDEDDSVVHLHKGGGTSVDPKQLQSMIQDAKKHSQELRKYLK
ncbi:exosome complex component RRP43 [Galendromus occidentalis]|uniref:Ribosomal RNA-processing protein 43 n=1 Tax=Galendromus occidentalis TaxID=34638 RepID=A0AAJ6VWT4_9ACAR|nr:exosome complex component RRP43 [Galendromus occidentalis]